MTLGPRSGARPARRRRVRGPGVACVLGLLVVATACGSPDAEPSPSGSAGSEDATTSPSPERSPSPSASDPSKPSGTVRLTGVVRTSPEDRLVVLEARAGDGQPARTWVLLGPVRSLRDGERVTVVGRPAPDVDTTGQRGPAFTVESVER